MRKSSKNTLKINVQHLGGRDSIQPQSSAEVTLRKPGLVAAGDQNIDINFYSSKLDDGTKNKKGRKTMENNSRP